MRPLQENSQFSTCLQTGTEPFLHKVHELCRSLAIDSKIPLEVFYGNTFGCILGNYYIKNYLNIAKGSKI